MIHGQYNGFGGFGFLAQFYNSTVKTTHYTE